VLDHVFAENEVKLTVLERESLGRIQMDNAWRLRGKIGVEPGIQNVGPTPYMQLPYLVVAEIGTHDASVVFSHFLVSLEIRYITAPLRVT
jgi:hypothetical protein